MVLHITRDQILGCIHGPTSYESLERKFAKTEKHILILKARLLKLQTQGKIFLVVQNGKTYYDKVA